MDLYVAPEKGEKGTVSNECLCEKCLERAKDAWEVERADEEAEKALNRLLVIFAQGHKFDVGAMLPYFAKLTEKWMDGQQMIVGWDERDKIMRAFLHAARKAVIDGLDDAEVIARAEKSARNMAEYLRKNDGIEGKPR